MHLDARQRIFHWMECPRQWVVFELAATDALTVAGRKWGKRRKKAKSPEHQRHLGLFLLSGLGHRVSRLTIAWREGEWESLALCDITSNFPFLYPVLKRTAMVYWKCCILMSLSPSFPRSAYIALLTGRTPCFFRAKGNIFPQYSLNIVLINSFLVFP